MIMMIMMMIRSRMIMIMMHYDADDGCDHDTLLGKSMKTIVLSFSYHGLIPLLSLGELLSKLYFRLNAQNNI